MSDDSNLTLTTDDGIDLRADIATGTRTDLAAIVCHPHPQYGGSRHDHVVGAVFRRLTELAVPVCRFDFRHDHGGGEPERRDVTAAIEEMLRRAPEAGVLVVGYSFGADVALTVDHPRLVAWVGIAAPLSIFGTEAYVAGTDARPTILLAPAHDQFNPPATCRERTSFWVNTTVHEIAMADHFLQGALDDVSRQVETTVTRLTA